MTEDSGATATLNFAGEYFYRVILVASEHLVFY